MKKKLFIGTLLAITLILLVAFRHQATSFFIEKYLQSLSEKAFTYESSSFNKNVLTFKKPSWSNVKADKAVISYKIDILNRSLDINILVDHPSIFLEPVTIDWENLFSSIDNNSFFFKTNFQLQMASGELAWKDSKHAYFSLESAFGQHRQGGSLTLHLDNPSSATNSLVLHLFEQKARMQIELECHDLLISDFTELSANIFPFLRSWNISEGIAQGGIKVAFPEESDLFAQGDLTFNNIVFQQVDWQLKGVCPEMNLQFDSALKGKIELVSPASFSFQGGEGLKWDLHKLIGGVFFQGREAIQVSAEGVCEHQDVLSHALLSGNINLASKKLPEIDLSLKINTLTEVPRSSELAIHSLKDRQAIEIAISRFSHHDFNFFQAFIGTFWMDLEGITLRDGSIDAVVQANFSEKGMETLQIKNLLAESILIDLHPWNVAWKIQKIKGCGECHLLDKDIINGLSADLSIVNGEISWIEGNDQTNRFESIQTELSIRKGAIQKSMVGLKYRGLQGWLELDGDVALDNINATFSGAIKDVYPFVSDRIQKGLKQELDNHQVIISTFIKKNQEGIEFKGLLRLFDDPAKHIDQLEFNLTCAGWADLTCKQGWFYAKDLPLEKYLSPFLIKSGTGYLSGIGEFKGTFDQQNIIVHYDAQDVILKNEDLVIEVPRVYSESNSHSDPLVAYHRFDLVTGIAEGVLPIHHGTYFEKNSGLLFTDIHSRIVIEGEVIHCKELEAFSNGVYLAGEAIVDFSSPETGIFTVDMNFPTLDGHVSQVQQMLSHFKESSLLAKIPLEGNLSFRGRGGHLHFDFIPNDYSWQGRSEGAISDGVMIAEQVDLSLQDFCLEFSFDHQQNRLSFDDIQGTLLVGKKERVDEYLLISDRVCFVNFREREADFDVWLGDKDRDFIRVAGSTKQKDSDTIAFHINHNTTHFGDLHPIAFELSLKNWSELDAFHLQTRFQLSSFLRDLQSFQRTGLLCFSRHFLQQLQNVQDVEGVLDVNLFYDKDKASLIYQASGENITFHGHHFDMFSIDGKKQEKTWIIDQLQLDDLSLAADLRCHHDEWGVHFLGMRYGKSILMGLQGKYVNDGEYLDASVNLLEVDLEKLHEWDSLRPFVDLFKPKGNLHGTGKMKLKFVHGAPWIKIDTNLKTNIRDFQLGNLHINVAEPFECSYCPEKGFALRDVHAVVSADSSKEGGEFKLEIPQVSFDVSKDHLFLEKFHFSVPANHLAWTAQALHLQFPDLIDQRVVSLISESKKDGIFEAYLSINKQASHHHLRLELPKGLYTFLKKDYRLSDFIFEKEAQDLRFSAKWHDQKVPFWVKAHTLLPNLERGSLFLVDYMDQTTPLRIDWQYDPSLGFTINKALGKFFGLHLALSSDVNKKFQYPWVALRGDVNIDCQQAIPLLSQALADKIKSWQMGGVYLFKGSWVFDQESLGDILDHLHFKGTLASNDFMVKGYQFQNLSSVIDYAPDHITLKNIVSINPSGLFNCTEFNLAKNSFDQWVFNAPHILIENIKPSLLNDLNKKKPSKVKPLIIKQISLENCQGCLADASLFQGKGSLFFLNPPKKNLRNTIFAIPAEILKRIGLDPSVMTPVTGTISLQIKGDRIYLTKMKDVYSEGRASKFYLARRAESSWVDFDGNLYAQVRMKQYNLLFKLAELFTVTITGNINKPIYTLQKQTHSSQAPQEITVDTSSI